MSTHEPDERTEFEAAAFRRLVAHLQERSDVQNIDLMTLAGFCRNCLSNWYREASEAAGQPMTKDQSREAIYGMPYDTWKQSFQREADDTQKSAFESNKPRDEMKAAVRNPLDLKS